MNENVVVVWVELESMEDSNDEIVDYMWLQNAVWVELESMEDLL